MARKTLSERKADKLAELNRIKAELAELESKAARHSRATRASLRFSAASAAFHKAARSGTGTPAGVTISDDNTPPLRVKSNTSPVRSSTSDDAER